MENAADALKIGFSIFVFVVAIALAVSVIGQARATADAVFYSSDKTEFYEYVTQDDDITEDRIVGMETIIPTIHRYAKEQYAVTIFDRNGNFIVRYDLWLEGLLSDWNEIYKNQQKNHNNTTYELVKERIESLYDAIGKTYSDLTETQVNTIMETLYHVNNKNNTTVKVGAPWIGDNDEIQNRIEADMLGTTYTRNSITYTGKKLKQYKNKKYIEKYLEVTTDEGTVITEGDESIETVSSTKKLEIIYIMQ